MVQALPHGRGMVGHVRRQFASLRADLDEATAFAATDPFDAAARKLALVGHVEQPVLEARRAEIGTRTFIALSSFRQGSPHRTDSVAANVAETYDR